MYKAIQIALNEVGYLEKASNADLDSKTGNAGFANYTKYARDLDNLGDFYNGKKQGYPWCECFVDWCFYKAYGEAMALTLLCQPRHSAGAGCTQSAQYYKAQGRFYSSPKVGDQIFFTWGGGDVEHTGLVYAVDATTVYTVEGNTSGKSGLVPNGGGVYKKQYARNNGIIYGYGRPDYALCDNGNGGGTPADDTDQGNGGTCEVTLQVLSTGSTGSEVKALQALLIKRWGISCGVYGMDGDFGSATKKAVINFQAKNNLVQDGVVGQLTWAKLLGVN